MRPRMYSSRTFFSGIICPLDDVSLLCNGGSLYAPYSLLLISSMLCDASFLPWEGVGGGRNRVVKLLYDPVFKVIIYCMDLKKSRRA
jgi:hypothetical protein